MSQKLRIAIGDYEMSFAFLHLESRRQRRRPTARRIHNYSGGNRSSIAQANAIRCHSLNYDTQKQIGAAGLHQESRRARWIDDAVAGHTESARQSRTQIRFGLSK